MAKFRFEHEDPRSAPVSESEVRRSYLVFPSWSQPLWTLLTGKPLRHEAPRWRVRPELRLLLTVATMVILALTQYRLLRSGSLGCQVLGWALVTPGALVSAGLWRSIQVVFGHHAIHNTLMASGEAANDRLACLLTIFTLSQNEVEYERDHLDHHRRSIFTTLRDADANLLYRCGLRPGERESVLRRRLTITLFSPRFHLGFLMSRLGSNLRRPPAWRGLALVWMVLVFVVAPLTFRLVPTLLILWLPLVVLYQMSALLQFSTEHVWLQSSEGPPCMTSYAEKCMGRFCGEAVPGHDEGPAGWRTWARWWLRTLCIHLPARLCVLVGDLPAHDWHHLCGILRQDSSAWPSAIYERQRAIDNGHCLDMWTREVWGLDQMVTYVLRSLAQAPPLTPSSSAAVLRQSTVAAFASVQEP